MTIGKTEGNIKKLGHSLSTKGVSLEQSGADQCSKSRPTQKAADQSTGEQPAQQKQTGREHSCLAREGADPIAAS